jgi:hypothetical protein
LNMRLEHYLYANPPDGYILICWFNFCNERLTWICDRSLELE